MAEYLMINDTHLSDRPPSSCTDSYLDDLFDLLRETVLIAEQRQAVAVIFAGDIYHYKTPSRTTHATVMRLIELCRTYPCPVYVVPGNHDIANDRFDSLRQTQPLGVVIASGAMRLLDGWMTGGSDPVVYGVPWQMRWEDDFVTESLVDWRKSSLEDGHKLLVTHAPFYPPGQELKYEFYSTARFAELMGGRGGVHYGHVHQPHGTYEVGGVTFCNPGALSRGSLHEHNLTREIAISAWDSETGQFEIVPVPHKPAAQVFRLAEAGAAKTAQLSLDEFLGRVGQTRLEITSIESVIAHIRTLGLGPELEVMAEELLTAGADR